MDSEDTMAKLRRWEAGGGTWRVLHLAEREAVVELCACTGEPMERVTGAGRRLLDYLAARGDSELPEPGAPGRPSR